VNDDFRIMSRYHHHLWNTSYSFTSLSLSLSLF
jgi:hypothetical protein